MKRLNMLNRVANKDPDMAHKMEMFSFYTLFLSLMNLSFVNKLTAREIDTLAAIMVICPNKDAFKGVPAQRVRALINMKSPNYLKMRDGLSEKGFVKDNKLRDSLANYALYCKKGDKIELKFVIEII